jgi:hypothetical protein
MRCVKPFSPDLRSSERRGMALGFVIIILLVLTIGGMALSYLSRGVQSQLVYADAAMRAQYIAEAGCHKLIARTMAKSWDDRWFKGGPDTGYGLAYGGGTWDYFIQDTPGQARHADIWTRGVFKDVKRACFFRFEYRPSLLSGLNNLTLANALPLDEDDFPSNSSSLNAMTLQVEQLIDKRQTNKHAADQQVTTILANPQLVGVLGTLGQPAQGEIVTPSIMPIMQALVIPPTPVRVEQRVEGTTEFSWPDNPGKHVKKKKKGHKDKHKERVEKIKDARDAGVPPAPLGPPGPGPLPPPPLPPPPPPPPPPPE